MLLTQNLWRYARQSQMDTLGPLPINHSINYSILVVVDCYSCYYEDYVLTSITTEKVINILESIFSRHGLPINCKSQNGPQFKSYLFRGYCETKGIKHMKTTREGLDWKCELRQYVTVYQSRHHATTGKSPAELLFNRKIKGNIKGDICVNHAQQHGRYVIKSKNERYADE